MRELTFPNVLLQAGTRLGDYRLIRRIGAGGMADVFLGEKIGAEGFARTVAIKTILTQGAEEEAINLFLDEARVAGFLNHPAIVETLDLGFESETLFIVMEYIAGPPLSRIVRELERQKRFLAHEIVAYTGARVASALDYAHQRATSPDGRRLALIHRDISPQNIMLTRSGLVKLTDFGVARASTQTHRTKTGQVRGKAAYMAPEQVRAKELDGRTDIFALGLVLYEALTSSRAYQRNSDINSMRAILTDPVKPIRSLNPSTPDDLITVVMKAIEKKPEDRWQTAGEMESALLACCRKAPSLIEADLRDEIDRIFGPPETYADADGVEAWQPTMAASETPVQRLPGTELSPRIREMLGTPSSSSTSVELTPPVDRTPAMTKPTKPKRSPMILAVPILALLIVAVGALATMVLSKSASPAPPTMISAPAADPTPVLTPRLDPAATKEEREPIEKPAKKIERPERVERPKKRAKIEPTPVSTPTPDLKERAMKVWRAHQQRGDREWAERLQSVVINLQMRPPSPADEKLVREAEAALGSAR